MTTPATEPLMTDHEISTLNAARFALEAIATRAQRSEARNALRLAGVSAIVADNIFDVLNVASSYCDVALTKVQLHRVEA